MLVVITVSKLRLPIYLGGAYVLGGLSLIGVLAGTDWSVPRHAVGVVAVTTVLILVAELLPIRLWIGGAYREYTYSGAFLLALLATGPLGYAVVPQLTALLIVELRQGKPAKVVAFNVSQYAVMFALAGLAVCVVEGGRFGAYEDVPQTRQILGLLVAAPVYFLVNNTMTATVIALVRDMRVLTTVVDTLRKELPITALVLGLAPLIIAGLRFSLLLAPLCLALIVALRHAAKIATTHQVAAVHDALTGLPNRTLMVMRTDEALHDVRRDDGSTALLLVDLDRFKEINDTLGHAVGDELLRAVADRLTAAIGDDDTAARLGGDEFAVVLPGATESAAVDLAERLTAALREPYRLTDVTVKVGGSVGVAVAPAHGTTVESLMRHADAALYAAKENRGEHAVYDPDSDRHTTDRPVLMGQLREGLDRGEVVVHYQPKVSALNGVVMGAEALVRWQHPTRGLLAPADFLPAVETSGLITSLTDHVIRDALRSVRRWREYNVDMCVAVNLTAGQVANLDLPGRIEDALAEHSLPGEVLVIEMTESSLMSDVARTRAVLSRLRASGVRLSIDDFGTGYSSFTHLRDLPVAEIKIDKSFVSAAPTSSANAAIVKSTIGLAHNLGLEVVAEGVESEVCLDVVTDMGCDIVQGYLLARPMPAAEFLDWSASRVATAGFAAPTPSPQVERIIVPC
jgi:diguanylate cyclase (GGDEF)-like protein